MMKPKLFYIGQAVVVDADCHFIGEPSADPLPDVVYHVAGYEAHPELPRWMIHLVEFPNDGTYWMAWDEAGFCPVQGITAGELAELLTQELVVS